ncbi:hypothetical protein I7I53_01402 [Histoplasma capsulatum var. duboisii H88]|uniref:Uncharacterized protein n=1 Tax=Ajellomyces capsulatus (strain H88) TaxID=544711 RepID=A0A8A1LLQ0_AJEC8|nr:hypothetical protein I7I53_01402 [Histoplasma capsulatum var. duboisii H88]
MSNVVNLPMFSLFPARRAEYSEEWSPSLSRIGYWNVTSYLEIINKERGREYIVVRERPRKK